MSTPPYSIDTYTAKITSVFNQQPKFMAMVELFLQGLINNQNVVASYQQLFNLYTAVGDQLDILGQWIGAGRNLRIEVNGTSVLTDDDYRVLLEAVVAQNYWDGTVPGAYSIWGLVFARNGYQIYIQDNQDMSMFLVFVGTASNVVLAMILNGYIDLRPAGVLMLGYFEPSVPNVPFFGLDAENATVSGLDVGAWVVEIEA